MKKIIFDPVVLVCIGLGAFVLALIDCIAHNTMDMTDATLFTKIMAGIMLAILVWWFLIYLIIPLFKRLF